MIRFKKILLSYLYLLIFQMSQTYKRQVLMMEIFGETRFGSEECFSLLPCKL